MKITLAGVAQWIELKPANHTVTGLIPSQGTCLGCRPRGNPSMFLSHIDVSLFLFLPPLSIEINKILKKKKEAYGKAIEPWNFSYKPIWRFFVPCPHPQVIMCPHLKSLIIACGRKKEEKERRNHVYDLCDDSYLSTIA